jgi:hypothetical protein
VSDEITKEPNKTMSDTHEQHHSTHDDLLHGKTDLNLAVIGTLGVASTFAVAAIIIATHAWFGYEVRLELQTKSLAIRNQELHDLRMEQQRKITTYRWVDQKASRVAIPIDRAMTLIVADHKRTTETGH